MEKIKAITFFALSAAAMVAFLHAIMKDIYFGEDMNVIMLSALLASERALIFHEPWTASGLFSVLGWRHGIVNFGFTTLVYYIFDWLELKSISEQLWLLPNYLFLIGYSFGCFLLTRKLKFNLFQSIFFMVLAIFAPLVAAWTRVYGLQSISNIFLLLFLFYFLCGSPSFKSAFAASLTLSVLILNFNAFPFVFLSLMLFFYFDKEWVKLFRGLDSKLLFAIVFFPAMSGFLLISIYLLGIQGGGMLGYSLQIGSPNRTVLEKIVNMSNLYMVAVYMGPIIFAFIFIFAKSIFERAKFLTREKVLPLCFIAGLSPIVLLRYPSEVSSFYSIVLLPFFAYMLCVFYKNLSSKVLIIFCNLCWFLIYVYGPFGFWGAPANTKFIEIIKSAGYVFRTFENFNPNFPKGGIAIDQTDIGVGYTYIRYFGSQPTSLDSISNTKGVEYIYSFLERKQLDIPESFKIKYEIFKNDELKAIIYQRNFMGDKVAINSSKANYIFDTLYGNTNFIKTTGPNSIW